jgi:hypothetical protein
MRVRPADGGGPAGGFVSEGGRMSDDERQHDHEQEQVYGPERARELVARLRALAQRIEELDRTGRLLEAVPELQQLLGNARSELFHYEVRLTYDTPEIADSRRIVEEARRRAQEQGLGWAAGEDEPPDWRKDVEE